MAVVFGECGHKCLSAPGNTVRICSLPAGPVRQGKEGGLVQEGSRSGRYGGVGGVGCTYGTAESSVDSWKEGRTGVIQTKWRSSVVGERFYEAILTSPHP
jgi:hypothetical protein